MTDNWHEAVDRPHPPALGERASRRIHGLIARDLGVAIVSGRYAPGDVLSGEIEFAGKLAVSRSAYREATRMLAAKGLVESRPKTGTKVSPQKHWNMLDPARPPLPITG